MNNIYRIFPKKKKKTSQGRAGQETRQETRQGRKQKIYFLTFCLKKFTPFKLYFLYKIFILLFFLLSQVVSQYGTVEGGFDY
jgi:hypothetical protein